MLKLLKLMTAAATALLTTAGTAAQDQAGGADQAQQPARAPDTAMRAETRVLNFMRLSNRSEIRAAGIVLERTQSDTVRRFADRLLRDHRLSDQMLDRLAESKGIALTPVSSDPLGNGQQQAQPARWDLPRIDEPPSAEQVRWESAPREERQVPAERLDTPPPEPDQADIPPDAPGETPRQPRDPIAREDPPPATDDRAADRPLDLDIARIKAERMLRELESADDARIDAVYAAAMIKSHDETVQGLGAGVQSIADADVRDLADTFIPILEQHARLARHVQRELGGEAVAESDQERR